MRSDAELIDHILNHIDNGTTDLGDEVWYEPVENYSSQDRFDAERRLMRRLPIPFCPVAALPEPGSYVARVAAGVPLVVVRDLDNNIRAFRNACGIAACSLQKGQVAPEYFAALTMAWPNV